MRIEIAHLKRAGLVLASIGLAGFAIYQFYAWWSSRPTESAFLAAIRESASRNPQAMRVCVPVPSPQYPDEFLSDRIYQDQRAYLIWKFDDAAPETFADMARSDGRQPSKYEIDAAARYLSDQRPRVMLQLAALEKAGFLSGSPARFPRGGSLYNATLYEPTLAGYLAMPGGARSGCFMAGARDAYRILEWKKVGDTGAGIEGYAVRYSVAVSERLPWTTLPEVQKAFPELDKQLGPAESVAVLVRGSSGWIDAQTWREHISRAQWKVEGERGLDKRLQEMKLGTNWNQWLVYAQLQYFKYFSDGEAPAQPVSNSTIVSLLDKWEDQFHKHAACLRFPETREGDKLEKDNDGEVVLLELPGRSDRDQWQIERVRRRLEALVRVGLAERVDASALVFGGYQPKEAKGMAFPGAVYRKTPKMLAVVTKQRDCVLLGKLRFEIRSQDSSDRHQIGFHGVAAIMETTDIARELQAELPEVKRALTEGLHLSGTVTRGQPFMGPAAQSVQPRLAMPFMIDPDLALKHAQVRSTVVAAAPAGPAAVAVAPPPAAAPMKAAEWGPAKGAPKVTWRQGQHGGHVLDEGLSVEHRGSGGSSSVVATKGYSSGQWYFELKLAVGPGNKHVGTWTNAGVAALSSGDQPVAASTGAKLEDKRAALVFKWGDWSYIKDGTIVGIALDLEKRRMWYRLDGNWINGNPELGSGGFELARFETFYALAVPSGSKEQADRWAANFGHRPFAHPSPKGFRPYDS